MRKVLPVLFLLYVLAVILYGPSGKGFKVYFTKLLWLTPGTVLYLVIQDRQYRKLEARDDRVRQEQEMEAFREDQDRFGI